jgi:hypothetical protein
MQDVIRALDERIGSLRRELEALTTAKNHLLAGMATISSAVEVPKEEPKVSRRSSARPGYSEDLRRAVVADIRNGMSYTHAAKKYGVTWFTAREWDQSGRWEPEGKLKRRGSAA